MTLLLAVAVACADGNPGVRVGGAKAAVHLSTIPSDEVTLTGRVTALYGRYVFAVGSGAERVVVVTPTPVAASIGTNVDVAGRVRTFRRRELETELGVDLGPQSDELENGSCLVATVARVL